MDADIVCFRRCTSPMCSYKEPRGSRQGSFWAGKFVCDRHFIELAKERKEILEGEFRKACASSGISADDYNHVRARYLEAMKVYHDALGFGAPGQAVQDPR